MEKKKGAAMNIREYLSTHDIGFLILFVIIGLGLLAGIFIARAAARSGGAVNAIFCWPLAVLGVPPPVFVVYISVFGRDSGDWIGVIAPMFVGLVNVFLYWVAYAFFFSPSGTVRPDVTTIGKAIKTFKGYAIIREVEGVSVNGNKFFGVLEAESWINSEIATKV